MAEGFEPYHVPQQSRRDKLRVDHHHHQPGCVDTLQSCAPFYDPSLLSPDFLNCAANLHHHSFNLFAAGVKEEAAANFAAGMTVNPIYADPHLSVHLNPTAIQDISAAAPYVYSSYRGGLFDQPFHGNDAPPPYKPATPISGGQSLSLSLSSHHSNLPLELNLQRYDSPVFSGSKVSEGYLMSNDKSSVPLGPFTGYASVLKGSRFLKPAQQLLEELCDVRRGIYAEKNGVDSSLLDPPPLESLSGSEIVDDSVNGVDQTRKKSRLLSMLDEVYKRYKQYYQQMQAAVAAFESVAGLSGAAPFANLALKAMSKHFRSLKNAITDQLHFSSKSHGKINSERDESRVENSGRNSYNQRPYHPGFNDQPVWRPQRGLPERAVTVLRAWLFEHFLHPYPTDTDKIMLAKQTGLTRNQVSNWFINARVRLWKPMVEEIHMLETRQGQKGSLQREEVETSDHHLPTIQCENASTSIQKSGDFPLKRSREETNEIDHGGSMGQMKMTYENNLVNNPHNMGVGLSSAGNVSLTLGLHQNGVGLNDSSYPMHAARRYSSHAGDGYVVSGFAAQNRQFMDGQFMHDFVG